MDTFVDSLSSFTTSFDDLSSVDTTVDSVSSDTTTLYPDLSTIHQEHIQNATSTIQSLLSSLKQANSELAETRKEIPEHPYDRLKWEHCHRDAEPFDFDSVEVPQDFCFKESHKALGEISQSYSDSFAKHIELTSLSGFDISNHPHFGNVFAEYNEGALQVNKDRITKHFQFLDMVKSIPLDYVVNNPKEFSQKIIAKYIEIHKS